MLGFISGFPSSPRVFETAVWSAKTTKNQQKQSYPQLANHMHLTVFLLANQIHKPELEVREKILLLHTS